MSTMKTSYQFAAKARSAPARRAAPAREPKYKNRKTVVGSETFDSAAEANRYWALCQLQKAGVIRDLARQVMFVLAPRVVIHGKTKPALRYCADFSYTDTASGQSVVEDKKGALTDVYKIKRHLMKSVHGIDILET